MKISQIIFEDIFYKNCPKWASVLFWMRDMKRIWMHSTPWFSQSSIQRCSKSNWKFPAWMPLVITEIGEKSSGKLSGVIHVNPEMSETLLTYTYWTLQSSEAISFPWLPRFSYVLQDQGWGRGEGDIFNTPVWRIGSSQSYQCSLLYGVHTILLAQEYWPYSKINSPIQICVSP